MNKLAILLLLSFLIPNFTTQAQVWNEITDVNPNYAFFGNLSFANQSKAWLTNGTIVAKSKDGGLSWESTNIPLFGYDVPLNSEVHFINENVGFLLRYGNDYGMILKTTDGGDTWNTSDSWEVGGNPYYQPISIAFLNEQVGIVGCLAGPILRTEDGGISWEEVNTPFTGLANLNNIYKIHFKSDTEWWAVTSIGAVLHSTDQGKNWAIHPGSEDVGNILYDITFSTDSIGWILGNGNVILKSIDKGLTWQAVPDMPGGDYRSIYFLNEEIGFIGGAFIGEPNLFMTQDGGITWQEATTIPEMTTEPIDFERQPNGSLFTLLREGGIYKLDITTAQEEVSPINSLKVYPNPISEFIFLEGNWEEGIAQLYDSEGKLVRQYPLFSSKEQLPVQQLASGLYFLKVTSENFSTIRRVVKL